jgi:hypothetical protein
MNAYPFTTRRLRNLSGIAFLASCIVAGSGKMAASCFAPQGWTATSGISQFDCLELVYAAASGDTCESSCQSACQSSWSGNMWTENNCADTGSNWYSGAVACECQ